MFCMNDCFTNVMSQQTLFGRTFLILGYPKRSETCLDSNGNSQVIVPIRNSSALEQFATYMNNYVSQTILLFFGEISKKY